MREPSSRGRTARRRRQVVHRTRSVRTIGPPAARSRRVIILLWIVIGLAAGRMIGALMLGQDSRRSRELSAGLMGAFLGPIVLQLSDPVVRVNALTGSLAALAGALWVAWIVCVVTSG